MIETGTTGVQNVNREMPKARALLKAASNALPANKVALLEALLDLIHVARGWDGSADAKWIASLAETWTKLQRLLESVGPKVEKPPESSADALALIFDRMPPFLRKGMEGMKKGVVAQFEGKSGDQVAEALREAVEVYPEGLVRFMLGSVLFHQKKFAEAEKHLLAASSGPAIVPIQRQALFAAIMAEIAQAWGKDDGAAPETLRPEKARAALDNLRRLMRMGRLTPLEASYLYKVARNNGEYDLARHILTDWFRESASVEALQKRVEMEWQAGCYFVALEVLKTWEGQAPNDPKLKDYRAETVRRLKQAAGEL